MVIKMENNKNLELIIDDINTSICKNYQEFIEFHNNLLGKITEKAQTSVIYKNKIKKIDDINKLNELALTSWDDIHTNIKKFGLENVLLAEPAKYWQTSGHTGESKKFYYSEEDLEKIIKIGNQLAYLIGIRPKYVVWNLGASEPYVSGSIATILGKYLQLNEINSNLTDMKDFIKGLKQASKADKIDVIWGIPLVYLTLGQIVNNPESFEKKVQEGVSEKIRPLKFLSKPIAKMYLRGINYKKLKENLENAKVGFTFAEPIKPHLKNIKTFFPNLTIRDIYGSTELLLGALQLSDNSDLSVMLNWFIPEIAPPEEIMKAKQDPSFKVNAVPWYEWKKGMKGELIATRPGDCLPLIRYPTGDLIEVVNPAETHHLKINNRTFTVTLPTMKILGRSAELVDFSTPEEMGIFMGGKVYNREIQEAMAWVSEHGKVKWWDLYVIPPNDIPFTKFKFEIIPENEIKNEKAFKKEIAHLLRRECKELDYLLGKIEEMYPNKFTDKLIEINILPPQSYKEKVDKVLEERLKQGRPLGQIKPKQIHIIKPEGNKNEKQN
jgi:phenylacetate-coenzyme A ligase PaaK-like adenylate-forming protein